MYPDSQPPRFSAIRLIFLRELRDQLRDRRTIFSIAVLPMLLYPMLGMLSLNIGQLFSGKQSLTVAIVGADQLPQSPPLLVDRKINDQYLSNPQSIHLNLYDYDEIQDGNVDAVCRQWVNDGIADAVVVVPHHFLTDSAQVPQAKDGVEKDTTEKDTTEKDSPANPSTGPPAGKSLDNAQIDPHQLTVLYSIKSERSAIAGDRLQRVIDQWRDALVNRRLTSHGIDPEILAPFKIKSLDIAPASTRQTAFWSKLLPFVMFVWAMTGAFYPAIDLVAGEKERGTLETLLCSRALRSEIVWGKLMAVTSFSIMTALLNVLSMQLTASLVLRQSGLDGMSSTSPLGLLWLLIALIPLASLFSALALAIAAMARSSKEGQYYLMPLMMVTLPLVLIPVLPGTTMSLQYTIIPVTGLFLLVKSLVEGQYTDALLHLPVVSLVTLGCLYLAVRWAQRQFETEEVLFRDGDQLDIAAWFRHLRRDRQPVPTAFHSVMCGMVVLIALFYGRLAISMEIKSWGDLCNSVLLPQIGLILGPMLIIAIMVTTSLKTSLRLRMPQRGAMLTALILGFALHPSYMLLGELITYCWPMADVAKDAIGSLVAIIDQQPLYWVILLMAVVPAVIEELTFRGFIFSGLARNGGGLRAVLVTALMFGFSHAIFQQSVAATLMGLVIGWVALRTGSVLPGIVIHVTNNALSVSLGRLPNTSETFDSWLGLIFQHVPDSEPRYQVWWAVVSACIAVVCLMYISLFHDESTEDEVIEQSELHWAREQQAQAELAEKHEASAARSNPSESQPQISKSPC